MPLNILFWVIYLIALILSFFVYYAPGTPWFRPFGGAFVLWILVGILGWRVFGPAIR
jgi:hypothetical protein